MDRTKAIVGMTAAFAAGILIGGFLFAGVQKRSVLAVTNCSEARCLHPNELAGLLASVGIQRAPDELPNVVKQTDKTVVFEYQPGWFILFPKKDIKNASDLREGDEAYLTDIYAAMGDLIREKKMTNWQIFTNGPDVQHITYMHFHLIDRSQAEEIPNF